MDGRVSLNEEGACPGQSTGLLSAVGVSPRQGTRVLLWLSLSRLPKGPVACLPWGSLAGQAEVSGAGVGGVCPPLPCWQGPRGIQELEVDPGFVAGSPAWPGTRRRLSFHCSGGATNCLDERG